MAFRSRLAGLATAAALACPVAGLIAALPGTAAQASTGAPATFACQAEQAAIHFINGSIHCQDYSRVTYVALKDDERIRQICAGAVTLAEVFPYGLVTRPVLPGKCELVSAYPLRTGVTVAALGF
jgi:hypothetical protein